jgi:hypothetical protein
MLLLVKKRRCVLIMSRNAYANSIQMILPSLHTDRRAMIYSLRLEVGRARRAKSPEDQVAKFSGFYHMPAGRRNDDRDIIHAVNADIFAATKIRFTYVP